MYIPVILDMGVLLLRCLAVLTLNSSSYVGSHLKTVVDSSSHLDGKSFDILSFDVRGLGHSTPNALCFPNDSTRDSFHVEGSAYGLLDSGPQALSIQMARAKVLGAICASRKGRMYFEPEKIGAYMGTASTARDVLEIVERLEDHRRNLNVKPSTTNKFQASLSDQTHGEASKLQYWALTWQLLRQHLRQYVP
jgi:hypothetical protein